MPPSGTAASPPSEPRVLWHPAADAATSSRLGEFLSFCAERRGLDFADYDALWRWSVGDDPRDPAGLEECWAAVWDFFDVRSSAPYETVLTERKMPGARWFTGARLNYAEHALRSGADDDIAIVGRSQSRERTELTWGALRAQVAGLRESLVELGVGQGDRVAAYLPNIPETVVAFLATASLGAVWTSCAPEFGVQAVLDRFAQVEPVVLFAVDGYRYGRHDVDRSAEVTAIRAGLPSLRHTIHLPYLHRDGEPPADARDFNDVVTASADRTGDIDFAQVAPDHPLYVLYSSGTTGLPKPIVHGHGGILLEHLKAIGLHGDMGPADRFFWFTTTGWMMWNYLVSGLLVGARLVLFDGDPNHGPNDEGPDTLWALAADEGVTWMGLGAPFITACRRAGITPGAIHDLSALRAVGSTGAPLPPEGFAWIYDAVSPDVLLSPISGGTDVCSAFVGGSPLTPVWQGEIPCRYLGAAVRAVDETGHEVVGTEGELVITQPMPSMPVGFWNDSDGSRYHAAYFADIAGVWRHGDWITITDRGSCIISGRSDATLNRGGVRVGTAEIYRVVESIDGIVDSLVVHLESAEPDDPGRLVLLVVTADDVNLDEALVAHIRATVRTGLSPRHVPDDVHQVVTIPTTLSGKKLELPVKKILLGADPATVASRDALRDPTALDAIVVLSQPNISTGTPSNR